MGCVVCVTCRRDSTVGWECSDDCDFICSLGMGSCKMKREKGYIYLPSNFTVVSAISYDKVNLK